MFPLTVSERLSCQEVAERAVPPFSPFLELSWQCLQYGQHCQVQEWPQGLKSVFGTEASRQTGLWWPPGAAHWSLAQVEDHLCLVRKTILLFNIYFNSCLKYFPGSQSEWLDLSPLLSLKKCHLCVQDWETYSRSRKAIWAKTLEAGETASLNLSKVKNRNLCNFIVDGKF